jgi:hypothetical protein
MGRRWIILKGGNREGVLTGVSGEDGLWGFEVSGEVFGEHEEDTLGTDSAGTGSGSKG